MTTEIQLVPKPEKKKRSAQSNVVLFGAAKATLQALPALVADTILPPLPCKLFLPSGSLEQPASNQAAALAHDARNLFSALNLFCELLSSPGVLTASFGHYAQDLRRVGEAGVRLIEALASDAHAEQRLPSAPRIGNLGSELMAMEELLRALAGPEIQFEIECAPGADGVDLNSEELLRILVNLVTNAVQALCRQAEEASPKSPRHRGIIRITLQRGGAASFLFPGQWATESAKTIVLSVRDNGPGIDELHLPHIFEPGYTTRPKLDYLEPANGGRREGSAPSRRRRSNLQSPQGLGLFIVRSLVETAGGAVRAFSSSGLGTRFDIELPIHATTDSGYPTERLEINFEKTSIPFRERRIEC